MRSPTKLALLSFVRSMYLLIICFSRRDLRNPYHTQNLEEVRRATVKHRGYNSPLKKGTSNPFFRQIRCVETYIQYVESTAGSTVDSETTLTRKILILLLQYD